MSRKLLKPEEIGAELRQVDVYVSRGQSVARSIGAILATEVSNYWWRYEYGALHDHLVAVAPNDRAASACSGWSGLLFATASI
jgi:hypothetical protein